ncbi:cytochrome oxidase c subunit VIb-domain-containing protein [Lipomyces chichibuensis]|uniref:cytochrome oxidase c subunit VIb-domain-containing protein n=1 Tax=Lipomyces chichibuensis TaxID=1546026 RepID=UPI003343EE15
MEKLHPPEREDTQVVTRLEREKCWIARDKYFACLDKNRIMSVANQDSSVCANERSDVDSLCRQSWVDYFIQRRERNLQIDAMKRFRTQQAYDELEAREAASKEELRNKFVKR